MYKRQINPPANWQDFEDLCQRLWRSILGDVVAFPTILKRIVNLKVS